jgi:hypothetical protein
MSHGFGIESQRAHAHAAQRRAARFLVVIDAAGATVARLFLESREQVAEFDASVDEVVQMIDGRMPVKGADGPEWDRALDGHSEAERRAADIYMLDV